MLPAEFPRQVEEVEKGRPRPIRMPQVPNRASRFFERLLYLRARLSQQIRGFRQVRTLKTSGRFQERRDSNTSLDHGVMHFARQPRSFVQKQREPGLRLAGV